MKTNIYIIAVSFYLIVVVIPISGCCICNRQKQDQGEHTLVWEGDLMHDDASKAIFVFDGKNVGKGQEGYLATKALIHKLPEGSALHVPTDYIHLLSLSPPDRLDTFPFRYHNLLYFASKRKIKIRIADKPAVDWLGEMEKAASHIIVGKVKDFAASESGGYSVLTVEVKQTVKGGDGPGEVVSVKTTAPITRRMPILKETDMTGKTYLFYFAKADTGNPLTYREGKDLYLLAAFPEE